MPEMLFVKPGTPPFTPWCFLCKDHLDRGWPTRVEAQDDVVWHVYREHRDHWNRVIGVRLPINPDPRQASS